MRANFFTKPVQGKIFRRQRDDIMNIHPESKYYSGRYRSELDNQENTNDGEVPVTGETVTGSNTSWTYRDMLMS